MTTPAPPGSGHPVDVPVEDRQLVDDVHDAVLAVPGVVDLHGGMFGEAASYLPGRRVAGIRQLEQVTEVHITVAFGPDVRQTANRVRAAVAALVDTPVHVTVEDIVRST